MFRVTNPRTFADSIAATHTTSCTHDTNVGAGRYEITILFTMSMKEEQNVYAAIEAKYSIF